MARPRGFRLPYHRCGATPLSHRQLKLRARGLCSRASVPLRSGVRPAPRRLGSSDIWFQKSRFRTESTPETLFGTNALGNGRQPKPSCLRHCPQSFGPRLALKMLRAGFAQPPRFKSVSTALLTAFRVSNTPSPERALASYSGTSFGLSKALSSATGMALGRSRLLYCTT